MLDFGASDAEAALLPSRSQCEIDVRSLSLVAYVNQSLVFPNTWDNPMSPKHREKLAEVARATQSALLHRLVQMIDTMDFEDWVVYALKIMTEDNASLRNDLLSKVPQMPPRVVITGTFEIRADTEKAESLPPAR